MILGSEAASSTQKKLGALWADLRGAYVLANQAKHLGLGKEVRPPSRARGGGTIEGHLAWRKGQPMGRQRTVHHA